MAPKVVHREDVGLETGSSYNDVCVTDRHAVPNAKLGFVTTLSMSTSFPASATSPRPSTKTRLEDVGLETGSNYSGICVIDRRAVSNAKLGFVTTPSVSASFPNVGDVAPTLHEDATRRCRPPNRK